MAETEFPLALVTGAARRLGRQFALALAKQGYAILLHFNQAGEKAVETGNEMQALGVPVFLYEADLTDASEVEGLFSFLDSIPHKLKVLVNSAAIMPRQDISTISVAEWDAVLDLNLRAPFLVAQKAVARMAEGGLIVNVTDAGAGKAWTGYPAYSISKTGLEALTRMLAKALAPVIRVNAIAPGLVMPNESIDKKEWEKLVRRLPLKRPADVDDITMALEFLIQNGSITGQTLFVDSGYSLL